MVEYLKKMSSSLPESRTEVTIVFEALRFIESLVIRADNDKKVCVVIIVVVTSLLRVIIIYCVIVSFPCRFSPPRS